MGLTLQCAVFSPYCAIGSSNQFQYSNCGLWLQDLYLEAFTSSYCSILFFYFVSNVHTFPFCWFVSRGVKDIELKMEWFFFYIRTLIINWGQRKPNLQFLFVKKIILELFSNLPCFAKLGLALGVTFMRLPCPSDLTSRA